MECLYIVMVPTLRSSAPLTTQVCHNEIQSGSTVLGTLLTMDMICQRQRGWMVMSNCMLNFSINLECHF